MNAITPRRQSAYIRANGRLARFADPRAVLADCLDLLNPPSRISVVQAAMEFREMAEDTHRGKWDPEKLPYMVEPMNMSQSRRYVGLVFVGPARAGKSDSLILNRILYLMTCVPGRVMLVNMDQKSAGEYSLSEIDRMIRNCAELQEKQESGRGAANLYQKLFKGGGRLEINWPVPTAFAQKTLRDVLITDRDRMPDDIGGDGDPFTLGKKRGTIAGSMAMCIEESSPSRPIGKRDWKATTIHEAPPCEGIMADYNLGTRARWYWTCPHCSAEFEADFHNLVIGDDGDLFARAQAVFMRCSKGCQIQFTERRGINLRGRWLHESRCGTRAVPIDDPDIRESDTLSYWLKGVAAAFQTWMRMALEYLQAVETFERTGSEKKLQVFWNTTNGVPHLPKAIEALAQLNAETLRERAMFRELGIVPPQVRFLTCQIDVQAGSFEVQVDGWGAGLERWLVDRFSITVPPETAPNAFDAQGKPRRPIQPALYLEDWDALDPLLDRIYPVTGAAHGLKVKAGSIDRNGPPGTTEKAYAFWRKRKRLGRWYLVTGMSSVQAERIVFAPPQKASNRYKRAARDVPIIKINTTLLKDEVCASLLRDETGPGYYHLPKTLEHRHFEEFCAEVRTEIRWEKKTGGLRNECFDLAYYGKALVVQLGGETMNWDAPQVWAVAGPENSFAVPIDVAPSMETPEAPPTRKTTVVSRAARLAARNLARMGAAA